MKTLLLFLALACAASGQTLKWKADFDAPLFAYEWAFADVKGDGVGGVAVCISYTDGGLAGLGTQFIWHSSNGARLAQDVESSFKSASLLQCTSTSALVIYTALDDSKILRKYSKRGRGVIQSDLQIPKADDVIVAAYSSDPDRLGFFVVTHSEDGHKAIGVRRYSNR